MDFNASNILVRRGGDGCWEVAAVLDWEFACAATGLCDVGNFLRYERHARPVCEPFFSDAYRANGGNLPDDWRALARVLDLVALCELLARPTLSTEAHADIVELLDTTIEACEPARPRVSPRDDAS